MSRFDMYTRLLFSVDFLHSATGWNFTTQGPDPPNCNLAHEENDMRFLNEQETTTVNGGGPLFPLRPIIEPDGGIRIPGLLPTMGFPLPLPLPLKPKTPLPSPIEPPICTCIGDPFDRDGYPRR